MVTAHFECQCVLGLQLTIDLKTFFVNIMSENCEKCSPSVLSLQSKTQRYSVKYDIKQKRQEMFIFEGLKCMKDDLIIIINNQNR